MSIFFNDNINDRNINFPNSSEIKTNNKHKHLDSQKISEILPITDKILAHVNEDFYISKATNQEGNKFADSIEYMIDCLGKLPNPLKSSQVKEVTENLKQCLAFEKKYLQECQSSDAACILARDLQEKIKALQPHQKIYFCGGWSADEGHAIMHAIEKQEDGNYTLYTFNTGGGIEFHDYQVDFRGDHRYLTPIKQINITEKNILNLNLLTSLFDLRTDPLSPGDSEYGGFIIYDSLLPLFGGEVQKINSIRPMRAQRSGTCSWKVLTSLLNEALDPVSYKRIKMEFRLQMIEGYLQDHSTLDRDQFFRLSQDLEKCFRELQKPNLKYSESELDVYFTKISQLKQQVDIFQVATVKKAGTQIVAVENAPSYSCRVKHLPLPWSENSVKFEDPTKRIPVNLPTDCPERDKVHEHLKKWVELSEKLNENGQYSDTIYAINKMIKNLPLPIPKIKNEDVKDAFWGNYGDRDRNELTQMIVSLSRLSELVFQSCFRLKRDHSDEKATVLTCLAIQGKLLENLLDFTRYSKSMGILGLQQHRYYEIYPGHIELFSKTNAFAHDPKMGARVNECVNLILGGWGIKEFLGVLIGENFNNSHHYHEDIHNKEEYNVIRGYIEDKAKSKNLWYPHYNDPSEKVIDTYLVGRLINSDFGQLGFLPDFIAALNKQVFITSYFFSENKFSKRANAKFPKNPYTIQTSTEESIISRFKNDRRDYIPEDAWVDGVDCRATRVQSAGNLEKTMLEAKFVNSDLGKLFKEYFDRLKSSKNPNLALTKYKNLKTLSPEDAKELITLMHSPKKLICWQLLNYFSQNIDKLKVRDYQLLFELLLYPQIEKELQQNPGFAAELMKFIQNNLEEFQAEADIDGYLFLVRVGIHLKQAVDFIGLKNIETPDWLSVLSQKEKKSTDIEEKQALQVQIAHYLSTISAEPSLDNLKKVFKGLSLLQTGQVKGGLRELSVLRSVLEWVYTNDQTIKQLPEDSISELCSIICSEAISGGIQKQQKWHCLEFPTYESEDKEMRVNLLPARAYFKNGPCHAVPSSLLDNEDFEKLFGKSVKSVSLDNFGSYYFKSNGHEFRAKISKGEGIEIEQKLEGNWYRYIHGSHLELPTLFKNDFSHWILPTTSQDNVKTHLYIQNSNFENCYIGTRTYVKAKHSEDGDAIKAKRIDIEIHPSNNSNLTLVDPEIYSDKDFNLSTLESTDFICVWGNAKGEVQEINFPRYSLCFTSELSPEPKTNFSGSLGIKEGKVRYCSKQFPGFYIAEDQKLEHFPKARQFLILTNSKGDRKVLIPNRSYKRKLSTDHPLLGKTKSEKDTPYSYQVFPLDKKGKPKIENQDQALNLVYLSLIQKDYETARAYLEIAEHKSGETLGTIVYKIVDLVQNTEAPDNHPKALAIALRAGILNLKNKRYKLSGSNSKEQNEISKVVNSLYKAYEKYIKADLNACDLRLTPKEELYLLQAFYNQKILGEDEFDRFIYLLKGKPLEKVQKKGVGVGNSNGRELQSSEWSEAFSDLAKWIDKLDDNFSSCLGVHDRTGIPLTRSKKYFIPFFVKVCLEIDDYTSNPEKKAQLEEHLRYIKWTQSMAFLRLCLIEVVQNPSDHTERLKKLKELLPGDDYRKNLYDWMVELGDYVRKKKRSKAESSKSRPLLNHIEALEFPQRMQVTSMSKSAIEINKNAFEWQKYFEPYTVNTKSTSLPVLNEDKPGLEPYEKHSIHLFNEERTKFYENETQVKLYKVTNSESLKLELRSQIAKEKAELEIKKKQLLGMANGNVDFDNLPLALKMEVMGGHKNTVSFEDLIVLYLQGSREDILQKCPGLKNSPEAAQAFIDNISEYLAKATAKQQNKRILNKVDRIIELQQQKSKEPNEDLEKEIENTTSEAYDLASARRVYEISSHPDWLVFEWASDILLREDQKRVLDILQKENVDPASTEVVIQLIMGAGKSKVLLPLLALKRADGEKLSMIVVPSSLYETNRRDLITFSVERLHQEPVAFVFDRSTPFTEEELQSKLWDLQNAIINKKYVVTTPESLLCLKLKYQEILQQLSEGQLNVERVEPKLRLLSSLLNLIKTRGWAILDEADTILNIRREVNFPVGQYCSVPKERLKLVKKIYQFLLRPDVESKLNIKANKPEVFNKSEFLNEIAPKLADYLMEGWPLEKLDKAELTQYLMGSFKGEILNGLSEHSKRREIALAKELICTFLPSVLNKKGNEKFGLSHATNSRYPIPYKGNNAPDEASEFGNIYETLLYAVHIYAQDGLKEPHIDALLQDTCRKIRFETKERGCIYKETPLFKKFTKIFGVENPFDLHNDERLKISERVKTNNEALFYWLMNYVYPEVKTTKQKINANALSLVDMINHVQGFTGTPWNRQTYHDRLNKPEREKELSCPENELKILHAIYQKVKNGGISTISGSTAPKLMNKILSDFKFDCLIDVGALLNGITNKTVAEELKKSAVKNNLNAVVYFNEENELVADLMDGSKPIGLTKVSLDKFLSYYDQIHTTGTDITQRPTAKALMTFGNKTVRDLTQGAMRMRKLLSSQNIEIVVPSELAAQISTEGKNPTFDQLLSYAVLHQAERLADDIVRKVRMQMKHIVFSNLDKFIKQQDLKTQATVYGLFEEVLTDSSSDDPFEEFGQGFALENTLKELENNRSQQVAIIQRLFSDVALQSLEPEVRQGLLQVKSLIDVELSSMKMPSQEVLKNQIPKERKADLKQDTKVEVEKEVEVEVEVEKEVMLHNVRPNYYNLWALWEKKFPYNDPLFYSTDKDEDIELMPKVVRINTLLSKDKVLESYKDIFDADLCTTNLFSQSVDPQQQILFGRETQKTAYQILFVVEPDKSVKALLVDPVESGKFKQIFSMGDDLSGRKLVLKDLTTGIKQSKGEPLSESEQAKFDRLAVQAKFFNGQLEYTNAEWAILKQWLNSVDTKKAKQLFEMIVSAHIGLEQKYQKSTLGKKWRESLHLY